MKGKLMKIGVIGCGQIADAHFQEIKRIPGAEVIAVCDLNKHLAEQAGKRFEIKGIYTDITKMIKDNKPDVVHITTPPTTHYNLGKIVLEFGCHIYMEKPFTNNLQEAEEIVTIAKNKGLEVCVGHNSAFDPSYLRLIEYFKKGKIGNIIHLNSGMGYGLGGPFGKVMMGDPNHWVHSLPGGIPQNNISHPVSLILGLISDDNIEVMAKGFRKREEKYGDKRDDFFDEIRVAMFSENSTANLVFSAQIQPLQLYIDAFGDAGIARLNVNSRSLTINTGATLPGPFAKVQWSRKDLREAKREFRLNLKNLVKSNIYFFDGMKILFERFYDALNGKAKMPIPMGETLRATKVIDDIFIQCKLNSN